jgi:hypothetical protein
MLMKAVPGMCQILFKLNVLVFSPFNPCVKCIVGCIQGSSSIVHEYWSC